MRQYALPLTLKRKPHNIVFLLFITVCMVLGFFVVLASAWEALSAELFWVPLCVTVFFAIPFIAFFLYYVLCQLPLKVVIGDILEVNYFFRKCTISREQVDKIFLGGVRDCGLALRVSGSGGPVAIKLKQASIHQRYVCLGDSILYDVYSGDGKKVDGAVEMYEILTREWVVRSS